MRDLGRIFGLSRSGKRKMAVLEGGLLCLEIGTSASL